MSMSQGWRARRSEHVVNVAKRLPAQGKRAVPKSPETNEMAATSDFPTDIRANVRI